jgi:hypothetical protein
MATTTTKAHWLSAPELEAMLQDLAAHPADVEKLRAAVEAIVEKLNRPVKIVGKGKVVTFEFPGLAFYNVSVREDEYRVLLQHEAAQLDLVYGYTDELAWRICGYPCSPAEMREARKKAESLGITNKKLPPSFFRPRKKSKQDQK